MEEYRIIGMMTYFILPYDFCKVDVDMNYRHAKFPENRVSLLWFDIVLLKDRGTPHLESFSASMLMNRMYNKQNYNHVASGAERAPSESVQSSSLALVRKKD